MAIHLAVPHSFPPRLGGAPMGRALPSQSLLSRWTTVLQLGNYPCQIDNMFCLMLVCCDQLVNRVVLLDGCICQVVKQCRHLLCLYNFLGSCLIGEGRVAGGHAVDVVRSRKCRRPVVFPVDPRVIREGMTFPLSPCKSHVPTVESMLGPSLDHHFLGDGYACVLHKCLALLLLVRLDGKWKVGIDSQVEIGDFAVEIRLADLGVYSANVGDKLM
jgi:hypothetical protein